MPTLNILKIAEAQFKLTWKELKDFELNLDFNPLLEKPFIRGYRSLVLLHWQGKPKKETVDGCGRQWGVYCKSSDTYFSGLATDFEFRVKNSYLIDVNEAVVTTLPTAVICYPVASVRQVKDKIVIEPAKP